MSEAENARGGYYERQWRIYAMIAAVVNRLDPTLAARPDEDSPGICLVRVRLAPDRTATFGQDIRWSGVVHGLVEGGGGYEWEGEERGFLKVAAPSLDFDDSAPELPGPGFEREGVTPVPADAAAVAWVAEAIVEAARKFREGYAAREGAVGYEYLSLWQDVVNPTPDARRKNDWRGQERFEKVSRFVLIWKERNEPSLYPADFARQPGALPSSPLFPALMSSLTTSWPGVREILTLEGCDAGEMLEELVTAGAVGRDAVLQKIRERKGRAEVAAAQVRVK
jgi:hypothetical protein